MTDVKGASLRLFMESLNITPYHSVFALLFFSFSLGWVSSKKCTKHVFFGKIGIILFLIVANLSAIQGFHLAGYFQFLIFSSSVLFSIVVYKIINTFRSRI